MKIKLTGLALLSLATAANAQTTIADWSYSSAISAPYNNPSATTGSGTGSVLGMANSYSGTASVASADVSDSITTAEYGWRIRGGTGASGGTPDGWATNAPIATQGAEFEVSTVGFTNINLSFDMGITTTGTSKMTVEYTINGSTWTIAPITSAGSDATIQNNTASANTITGNYIEMTTAGEFSTDITVDFNGVAGVANNADFAVEIVNASTGADDTRVGGAANPAGNVQFNNVDFTGTLVSTPEPTTFALAGVGVATGLLALRRNRKA